MRQFRKQLCSALALVALAGATSSAVFGNEATSGDSFTGAWRVKVTPDTAAQNAGKQEFGDEILFEDGKMVAAACASYGFGESSYTLTNGGLTMNSTVSQDGESIAWSASLVGGNLQGTVTWTKASGQTFHYVLQGTRLVEQSESDQSEN